MTDLSVQKRTTQRGGAAKHKIRLVTATRLFDGHDALINVMRRICRRATAKRSRNCHRPLMSESLNPEPSG